MGRSCNPLNMDAVPIRERTLVALLHQRISLQFASYGTLVKIKSIYGVPFSTGYEIVQL